MTPGLDLTGSILDRRYRITRLLGEGGMGHVYEAVHVVLDQLVAVKVLHPRYAYEERFRERFLQEARAASRIQHPNVVVIKDFGDTPQGSVYFVMEYLQGRDLGAELQEHGAMPWARARGILLQAASALHAAHVSHIIHRDIKPANCFLTRDEHTGGFDMVKLVDFGIAKVGGESHAEGQGKKLTGTGEVFGTASYMAPEHARGEVLDARSDVYSLGIMAYEMLVGRVPFTGGNSIHVITRHLNEAPKPLRSHDPEIPDEVDALVLRMLAKEPRDRFASMAAVEEALLAIAVDAQRTSSRVTILATGEPAVDSMAATAAEPKLPVASEATPEPSSVPTRQLAGGATSGPTMVATKEPAVESTSGPTMVSTEEPAVESTSGPTMVATKEPAVESTSKPTLIPTGEPAVAANPVRTVIATGEPAVEAASVGPRTASAAPTRELDGRSHSLEIRIPAEHKGRLALVAGLLLLLVGGGVALVTKAVLSDREASAGGEPQPKMSAAVELASAEGAAREAAVPVPGEARPAAPVPGEARPAPTVPGVGGALDGGAAREGAQAVEQDPTARAREAAVGETAAGGASPATPEIAEAPDDAPPARTDEGVAAPKVPEHETEKCAQVRKRADAALDGRDWTTLLAQARQKRCWSAATQAERRRLNVRALLELGRFGECLEAGGRATDAATKSMVETCRKRAG